MDEEELKLIERFWQGDSITDAEIEKNVADLYSLVNEDILHDQFLVENSITELDIVKELKRIEANLAAHNFIGNGEELRSEVVVYKRDQQP